jgi:hypothetical protein
MAFPIKVSTLQDGATTTGNGTAASGEAHIAHRFRVRCAGGTATVVIESTDDGSTFDELESLSMTAGTNEVREVTGPHVELRARISAISGATVDVVLEQYYSEPKGAAL